MDSTTASAPTTVASALRSDKKAPAIEDTNAHSRAGSTEISPTSQPEQKKSTSSAPQVESGSLTPHTGNSNGQPAGNAASRPEVHNVGITGRRVRFLDRAPVPPSFRGKEAQVELDTPGIVIVWVEGERRHVLKEWLVEEPDTNASASQT